MGVSIKGGGWGIPLACGLTIAVLGGLALFGGDGPADTPPPPTPVAAQRTTAPLNTPQAAPLSPGKASGGLADPARIFELGLAGDLVLNMDTQASLEMTLAELGPDPSAADLQRLEDGLRKGLPPTAAGEAIAMVRQYAAYSRDYARAIEAHPPADTLAAERAMLDRMAALQRKHFGEAVATQLFGLQQAHSRYQLDVQAIQADAQLSAADKSTRIQALRDRLPDEVRELDTAAPEPRAADAAGSGALPAGR